MIYFIHYPKAARIKIGTSVDVDKRMKALNSSGGYGKGVLLHTMPGSYAEERELLLRFTHLALWGEYFYPAMEIYEFIGRPELHRMQTMKHLGAFSETKRGELYRLLKREVDNDYSSRSTALLNRFEHAVKNETPPRAIPIVLRFAVSWNDHTHRFSYARWLDPYYRARKRFKRAWIAARDDANATRRYLARQARLKRSP